MPAVVGSGAWTLVFRGPGFYADGSAGAGSAGWLCHARCGGAGAAVVAGIAGRGRCRAVVDDAALAGTVADGNPGPGAALDDAGLPRPRPQLPDPASRQGPV